MRDALRPSSAAVFATTVLCLAAVACQSGNETNSTTPGGGGGDAAADGQGPSNVIDAGTFTINSTKPGFQTKSMAQLASTLVNCLGPTAGNVTADMFVGQPGGFLAPGTFVVTTSHGIDDVVTQQRKRFDGDPQALASGVRNDELTLEYVTGQRNVANVAGKRCQDTVAPPPLCACATFPEALAMITRCVPYLLPSDAPVRTAAQTLATACAADKGKAVASFIASTVFAKLP